MSKKESTSAASAGNQPMSGGAKMLLTQKKPKNMWASIKRLMGYMKKSIPLIVLTIIIAIAGTVAQVFTPKMLGNATTILFDGLRGGRGIDFDALESVLIFVAILFAGIFFATFLQQRLMVVVSQKTTYALRNELKAKMNKVPVSYFDKNANGNLMSVAVNDIDNIVTNLQQSLTDLISSVILVAGVLWIMITISPALTLIACIMIPGAVLIMTALTPIAKKNTNAYYKSLGELNGQVEEAYQGFAVVKSFNGEEAARQTFGGVNESMYRTGWKARFFGGLMMPSMSLVQNIIYVLIAVMGALRVVSGTITIGDMQAFFQYSTQFSQPLMKFTQIWNGVISMVASAERVFNMLDAAEMETYQSAFPNADAAAVSVTEAGAAAGRGAEDNRGAEAGRGGEDNRGAEKVVFEHVRFGYTDEPLMKDFNMEAASGRMVAIVGHTGAGKTTLINLLERFYEIQGGSIRIDGVDIRNMERSVLRRRIGMVLQDTWLFSGTIFDNIRYGNEDAADEQIYAAAKAAYADDFIQKLPDGYDTVLDEDAGNISQGQRQLITIARAFACSPEILILDEATSNVDSRTEMIIQSAMKRLLKGRTSFVVAHRLSTIYDADRILVMSDGDIVETGSHKELIAKEGVYADIYNSQFAH
ncbi:MAG: ABC transporter ATP-binding protein/permease [Clostridiales Family XIII bacterium]|jgi:ATP-binding cassette subfamily B protein|nr:ABC transporter ATP-binding protein/permease [Clostridiales Family XIII bacterium]